MKFVVIEVNTSTHKSTIRNIIIKAIQNTKKWDTRFKYNLTTKLNIAKLNWQTLINKNRFDKITQYASK